MCIILNLRLYSYKPCDQILQELTSTRNIYIMDHEIVSPDIDGSCDVYSSIKFAYPLAENGLLICVFI